MHGLASSAGLPRPHFVSRSCEIKCGMGDDMLLLHQVIGIGTLLFVCFLMGGGAVSDATKQLIHC